MNQKIVLYICLVAIIGFAVATDYCSSSLCNAGTTHIACGNSGKFHSSCPANAVAVTFDDSMKAAIVKAHNEKRNFIAGGGVASLQPACRMATMQWDDELASIAALNVLQCKMSHDKCRNTDTFQYSGQNLAWRTYSGTPNYGKLFDIAMGMWYDEVSDTKMEYIDSFPTAYKGPAIGHFTVMMADRNIRVGCAAATYTDIRNSKKQIFLVACNYATTNVLGFPIYNSCSSAGSSCSTGKNPQYPNLCSTSEVYDVNKWY